MTYLGLDLGTSAIKGVLIDHDVHAVKQLCDRASVMKNGQLVGTVKVDEVTEDDILGMIILGKQPAQAA